ncbi:MAG TPA: VCBS repeat-containing protein [Planctomycetota bacterium]|nr:VCBS repeat-containing protein [Planctomycetota bacterium]
MPEHSTHIAGSFAAAREFAVGSDPNSIAIGDLDQDGLPDLAVANESTANTSVLLGHGDGTFDVHFFSAGFVPASVAIGDLDADGLPDLAIANAYSNDVTLLLNQH